MIKKVSGRENDGRYIREKDIALHAKRYRQLFDWVKKYADADLCAWLMAQDLNRATGGLRVRGNWQKRDSQPPPGKKVYKDGSSKIPEGTYIVPVRVP